MMKILAAHLLGFLLAVAASPLLENISNSSDTCVARAPAVPALGRFVAHGVANETECNAILEFARLSLTYMNITKYTAEFGLQSHFTPRESYRQIPMWHADPREPILRKVVTRAQRRVMRHFDQPQLAVMGIFVSCATPSPSPADCEARRQAGCTAYYYAFQWCDLVTVNRSEFWSCFLKQKEALTGSPNGLPSPQPGCQSFIVCWTCTITTCITAAFTVLAWTLRRFREFWVCLVCAWLVACVGPYRAGPCSENSCSIPASDYLGEPWNAENCVFDREGGPCFTYNAPHVYSAIVPLTRSRGAEYLFWKRPTTVAPSCGMMMGFSAGGEAAWARRGIEEGEHCILHIRFQRGPQSLNISHHGSERI